MFVPTRYADYLAKARKSGDDTAFRHYGELCVVPALRDGLRSGGVFAGLAPFRHPGTYPYTPEQWEAKRAAFCQLVLKPAQADKAIEQVKEQLHRALEDLEETLANASAQTAACGRPPTSPGRRTRRTRWMVTRSPGERSSARQTGGQFGRRPGDDQALNMA